MTGYLVTSAVRPHSNGLRRYKELLQQHAHAVEFRVRVACHAAVCHTWHGRKAIPFIVRNQDSCCAGLHAGVIADL